VIPDGTPIVLTADRTLMSHHRLLLDAMFLCSQTTRTPSRLVRWLFMPPVPHINHCATIAPLGLRRLEAALRRAGFTKEDVIIADERHLPFVVGPRTKFIGLSSGDPTGLGMNSTTMTAVVGGEIYPYKEFRRLMELVNSLRAAHSPAARIVLGGPGAWQLATNETLPRHLGLDSVILGYAEAEIASLAQKILQAESLPPFITTMSPPAEHIPPVQGATAMGALELSRGCGWGCDFCTLAHMPMLHIPADTIWADAETNLRAGQKNLVLLSEDLLRYGSVGRSVSPQALLSLLRSLRTLPEIRLLQADHANISSVAQYSEAQLQELHELLGDGRQRFPWLNLGIETASGELLERLGGKAKMHNVAIHEWGDFCREQIERLTHCHFIPMISLIIGSPQETEEDTHITLKWIRSLRGLPVMIFPIIYVPIDRPAFLAPLSPAQWQLMQEAYEFNYRWLPVVYEDSMHAGGIGFARRLAIRILGKTNIWRWRYFLRSRQHQALNNIAEK